MRRFSKCEVRLSTQDAHIQNMSLNLPEWQRPCLTQHLLTFALTDLHLAGWGSLRAWHFSRGVCVTASSSEGDEPKRHTLADAAFEGVADDTRRLSEHYSRSALTACSCCLCLR